MKPGYHSRVLGVFSNSARKEFVVSPFQYLDWAQNGGTEETQAMHEGTAFHMALHEPEKFAKRYVVLPDMPLTSKERKQEFLDRTLGDLLGVQVTANGEKAEDLRKSVAAQLSASKIFLLTELELATMRAMITSLNLPCHSLARSIVARGVKEREIRWTDAETGVQCKAKIDSWDGPNGVESDLKRTALITRSEFKRSAGNNGYHFQRAFYRRGLRALGEDVKYQCLTCAQPSRPFHWAVYDIPEDVVEACDAKISEDLVRFAECLSKNEWPTINNGQPVTLAMNAEYI